SARGPLTGSDGSGPPSRSLERSGPTGYTVPCRSTGSAFLLRSRPPPTTSSLLSAISDPHLVIVAAGLGLVDREARGTDRAARAAAGRVLRAAARPARPRDARRRREHVALEHGGVDPQFGAVQPLEAMALEDVHLTCRGRASAARA